MNAEQPPAPPHGEADQSAPVASTGAVPTTRSVARMALRLVLALLAFILIGALLVALVVQAGVNQATLRGWLETAQAIKRWGLLAQCLLLAAVGLWWHPIVRWGQRRGIVRPHELAQVLRLRWAVLAFGIAYLLLVPIGPTTLWRYLVS